MGSGMWALMELAERIFIGVIAPFYGVNTPVMFI